MTKDLTDNAEAECLKLKKAINENHRLAQTAAGEAIERGVLTGELLMRWKELLPHGRFESFVAAHFDGCLRTAQIYMQAAKRLNALPKAQRTALLKQERSIAGLISTSDKGKPEVVDTPPSGGTQPSYSDKGKPGGEASHAETGQSTSPSNTDGRAGGPGHGAETQHQASESSDAHPSAGPPDYGARPLVQKCPNCGGDKWDEDDEGWACSGCHEPHGEPAGDHVADSGKMVIATIEVFEDGWVEAFDHFWGQCPGAIKLVIRDRIQETTRRGSGFQPPTASEVRAYCDDRNNGIDAGVFVDYYESVGWKIGKKSMKDWKASVRTWERKKKEAGGKKDWLRDYLNRDKSKDAN